MVFLILDWRLDDILIYICHLARVLLFHFLISSCRLLLRKLVIMVPLSHSIVQTVTNQLQTFILEVWWFLLVNCRVIIIIIIKSQLIVLVIIAVGGERKSRSTSMVSIFWRWSLFVVLGINARCHTYSTIHSCGRYVVVLFSLRGEWLEGALIILRLRIYTTFKVCGSVCVQIWSLNDWRVVNLANLWVNCSIFIFDLEYFMILWLN